MTSTAADDELLTPVGPVRLPVGTRLLPRRIFYGWWVTLACAALMFVGTGVGFYGLAVFLRPLQDVHGWSNSVVSGATGMYFSVAGITGAVIGPRIDREGPLRYMLIGALLMGLAVSGIGFVNEIWQLYAVYFVLAVAFSLTTGVGVNAIVSRWFVTRRARALSIAATGVSLGGVVLSPLGAVLIDVGGIQLAATVMGALVVAVSVPVILGVIVWDPSHMDLAADNGAPAAGVTREALSDAVQRRVWTSAEAVRTAAFWAILIAFVLVLSAQSGFLLHQLSFLEDRFGSRQAAALALSTTAMGSIVARLIVGAFADRLDKRLLTAGLFVLQAGAVLVTVAIENTLVTYAMVLVVGFTIGNIYMMQALLVGEVFGIVSFGLVFGLIGLAVQVGAGSGPFLVGYAEDATGSYTVPFVVTSIATLVAAVFVLFARSPRPPSPTA